MFCFHILILIVVSTHLPPHTNKLTCLQAQADAARERALRIQNVKKLENAQNEHRVLQIRHDELVSRLALVADMEKNGTYVYHFFFKYC